MPRPKRVERKLAKKVSRLGETSEAALSAGTPAPLPAAHLQTRRERMLKKSLGVARRAADSSKATGKRRVDSRPERAAKTVAAPAGAAPRGRPQKRQRGAAAAVDPAVARVSLAQLSRRMRDNQSIQNLHAATRLRVFNAEVTQMNMVREHPAFAADPVAAIQQHLEATMARLQPQTPDYGRAPVAAAAGATGVSGGRGASGGGGGRGRGAPAAYPLPNPKKKKK